MDMDVTNSPWTRRMFLGSGVAIGAGSAAAVLAPPGLLGGGTVYTQPKDLVLDEIHRQFEGAVADLQGRATGEAARRIAASLRMLASWGQERNVDDDVRRHLLDAIRREGRAAMVSRPFDAVAELQVRGFKVAPNAVARARPTAADHGKALNGLLAGGITAQWTTLAKKFEAGAAGLDKSIGLASFQDEEEPNCEGMEFMELLLQSSVFFFCVYMAGVLWPACVVASLDLLGWQAYMWWEGC